MTQASYHTLPNKEALPAKGQHYDSIAPYEDIIAMYYDSTGVHVQMLELLMTIINSEYNVKEHENNGAVILESLLLDLAGLDSSQYREAFVLSLPRRAGQMKIQPIDNQAHQVSRFISRIFILSVVWKKSGIERIRAARSEISVNNRTLRSRIVSSISNSKKVRC
jgi:hypothetical protein